MARDVNFWTIPSNWLKLSGRIEPNWDWWHLKFQSCRSILQHAMLNKLQKKVTLLKNVFKKKIIIAIHKMCGLMWSRVPIVQVSCLECSWKLHRRNWWQNLRFHEMCKTVSSFPQSAPSFTFLPPRSCRRVKREWHTLRRQSRPSMFRSLWNLRDC